MKKRLKLYKFRSLAASSVDYVERIFKPDECWYSNVASNSSAGRNFTIRGNFWCSRFSEMNDPMEGVFNIPSDKNIRENVGDIFTEKNKYRICSFSGEKGFKNPAMWGYYANGFKGLAIEIEIDEDEVEKVKYVDDLPIFKQKGSFDDQIKEILTTKLRSWEHEAEYRFLKNTDDSDVKPSEKTEKGIECEIGKITAVYFGNPYGNVVNEGQCKSEEMKDYDKQKVKLTLLLKEKGIKCFSVETISIERKKGIVKKRAI